MAEEHSVAGYENFIEFMKNFSSSKKEINILFSGEKIDGVSWCPDCVEAEPIISDALKQFGDDSVLIHVDVGGRNQWKDINNPFRTDKLTHLSVIPSLIRWKKPQRLEGDQLLKPELLQMFFTEED